MPSKKAIIAATGFVATTVSAGGAALSKGLSSANSDPLVETSLDLKSDDSLPLVKSEHKVNSGDNAPPKAKPAETPPPSKPNPPKPKSMSDRIVNWYDVRQNNSGKNGYLGSEGAVSNVDFDIANAQQFSEVSKDTLANFLGEAKKGDYKSTRSSLRVRIQKRRYNSGKGFGTFSWFWSFSHKDKGFITFNVASSVQGHEYLQLTGGFYLVEKDSSTNQGKIKYYKEQEGTDKKITVENFKNYFPTPYWYTKQGEFDQYYYNHGGFGTEQELKSICGGDNCTETPQASTIVSSWEWAGREQWYEDYCSYSKYRWCDNVYEWSSDHDDKAELQGYDYMYGNNELNLKKALSTFYKGYGKKDFANVPKWNS